MEDVAVAELGCGVFIRRQLSQIESFNKHLLHLC